MMIPETQHTEMEMHSQLPDNPSISTDGEVLPAPTPQTKKPGRGKKIDPETGEQYHNKVTVYLTPSLEADLKMIAEAQDKTINEYFRDLAIADREERISEVKAVQEAKAAYQEALRKLRV